MDKETSELLAHVAMLLAHCGSQMTLKEAMPNASNRDTFLKASADACAMAIHLADVVRGIQHTEQ